MDFLKILRSFEEFVVEAASWLIFYPLTLWRIIRHPITTMEYSDREQSGGEDHRYDDAISPPLTLLATLLLANFIAAGLHVTPPEGTTQSLHAITASSQNLILFRSLLFSLAPLVAAVTLLRKQSKKLSRDSLRAPFYAQCYLAAPFAAAVSAGGVIMQRPDFNNAIGAAVVIVAIAWFMTCQTIWFRKKLVTSWMAAGLTAAWAMTRALIYLAVLVIPLALL